MLENRVFGQAVGGVTQDKLVTFTNIGCHYTEMVVAA